MTLLPSALAVLLLAGLLVFLWLRPPAPLLRPWVMALLAGAMLFALGDLVTASASSPGMDRAGGLGVYAGIALMTASFWILSLRTGELHGVRLPLARSRLAYLPPLWMLLLFAAAATDPWHGRFATPVPGARNAHHVLWYVNAASGYVIVLASLAVLGTVARRARGPLARSHALTIGLAAALTALGSALYVSWPHTLAFDPTALGICLGCVLVVLGIVRLRLFAPSPVPVTELLRQGSDGVLLLDRRGAVLDRNPAAEAWLPQGVAFGERLVDHWRGRFARAERPEAPLDAAELSRILLSDEPTPHGQLFQHLVDPRLLRIEVQPIRSARGDIVCRVLRLRDETYVRRLSEALGEQASALSAILAATDEGILVHVGGQIRFANPQFHEIWHTPSELRAAARPGSLLEAYLPMVENRESFLATLERVLRDPYLVVRDDIALRDGRVLERTSLPLVQDGVAMGRVWRVRDVTEQRGSEERLRNAQKLESLGVMAGGIAHDFNNLLVAVMGNAGLARAELGQGSPARDYLTDIERAAERASELTRQLLAYAGKGRVQLEPMDLSRIVRDVVDLLAVSIPKAVSLRCNLSTQLPPVTADASQLRQVVMNLLLNAADAIGEGEGAITLSTGVGTFTEEDRATLGGGDDFRPGQFVVLRVSDTGTGMDARVLSRIFDPFFSTKFTGRGLGLAATLGILRRHGGFVGVESEVGRGSRFTVLLPVAEERPHVPPVGPRRARRATSKILVVDDDPAVARVALRLLRRAGLEAVPARGGEEAIALYRARGAEFGAVLLDLTMPGRETLRAVRALDPGARIVFTGGHLAEEVAALADDSGAPFVQKPYRAEELVAALLRALGEEPGSGSADS